MLSLLLLIPFVFCNSISTTKTVNEYKNTSIMIENSSSSGSIMVVLLPVLLGVCLGIFFTSRSNRSDRDLEMLLLS